MQIIVLLLAFVLLYLVVAASVSIKRRRRTPDSPTPDDPMDKWDKRGPVGGKGRHLMPWGDTGRRRDG